MNKRWKFMLSAALVMCLAAACGNSTETTTADNESAVSESSSGEILMDSLEYLLSDDKEDVIQIPDTEDTEQDSAVQEGTAAETQETVSENPEDTVELVLYYSNGRFDSLDSETVEAEQLSPDIIISMLSMHNIVSLDTKVLSFEEEEMVGGNILHLDLSNEMEEYLCTMTREAENIIIASVTDTFLENYGAASIYITVEGEPLATPYAVYEEALKQCMPQDLMATSVEESED